MFYTFATSIIIRFLFFISTLATLIMFNTAYAQDVEVAGIGFNDVEPISGIINKLEEYDVYPTTIHMWVSGFSGSHARSTSVGTITGNDLFTSAKSEADRYFASALEGNTYRLNEISKRYTYDEIVNDSAFNDSLKELLLVRSQIENAIASLDSGEPFVYGLEVRGPPSALAKLKLDSYINASVLVSDFNSEGANNRARTIVQVIKPPHLGNVYQDTAVSNLTSVDVYDRIIEIAENR